MLKCKGELAQEVDWCTRILDDFKKVGSCDSPTETEETAKYMELLHFEMAISEAFVAEATSFMAA